MARRKPVVRKRKPKARPPKDASIEQLLGLLAENHPHREEINRSARLFKQVRLATEYLNVVKTNGAGLTMDMLARILIESINERSFQRRGLIPSGDTTAATGGDKFPFPLLPTTLHPCDYSKAPFLDEDPRGFWRLLPERDHIFCVQDFMEWLNSNPEATRGVSAADALMSLDVDVIHHFNCQSAARWALSYAPEADCPPDLAPAYTGRISPLGVSFVRRSATPDTITSMMTAADNDGRPITAIYMADRNSNRYVRFAYADDRFFTDDFVSHADLHGLVRRIMDVTDGPDIDRRYVEARQQAANNQHPLCEEVRRRIQTDSEELRKRSIAFTLMRELAFLQSYFEFKLTLVKEERRKTGFSPIKARLKKQRVEPQDKVRYRIVKSLRIVRPHAADGGTINRKFTEPSYQVPHRGHWRTLGPDRWGKDEDGRPILGKTWIRESVHYQQKPPAPKTILVKETIKSAVEASKRWVDRK